MSERRKLFKISATGWAIILLTLFVVFAGPSYFMTGTKSTFTFQTVGEEHKETESNETPNAQSAAEQEASAENPTDSP